MSVRDLHHLHKRKRAYKKLEAFPSVDPAKRMMDKLIYIIGLIGPIMSIPQILKIWGEQNAESISIYTVSSYLFASFCWLTYGTLHRETPLMISYSFWIVADSMLVIGTVLYG